tara:strand:+ start:111 stop:407 length:297 start_codon:yes stop_codon:yes gene_type:complete
MSFNIGYKCEALVCEANTLENKRRETMGAMRISDYYLSEVLLLCEWVIKNTETSNRQNIRAKSLIKRVKRFVNTAGHLNEINGHIKEDRNRATLDKFL